MNNSEDRRGLAHSSLGSNVPGASHHTLEAPGKIPLFNRLEARSDAHQLLNVNVALKLACVRLDTLKSVASQDMKQLLIATKQIYATHYFDAALGLTLVFDDHASGFYMLCVDRARTRSLTSFIRGFVRGIVQRRSRDAMEKILRTTKLTLER